MRFHQLQESVTENIFDDATSLLLLAKSKGATEVPTEKLYTQLQLMGHDIVLSDLVSLLTTSDVVVSVDEQKIIIGEPNPEGKKPKEDDTVSKLAQKQVDRKL